jgi:hypothetical protein
MSVDQSADWRQESTFFVLWTTRSRENSDQISPPQDTGTLSTVPLFVNMTGQYISMLTAASDMIAAMTEIAGETQDRWPDA